MLLAHCWVNFNISRSIHSRPLCLCQLQIWWQIWGQPCIYHYAMFKFSIFKHIWGTNCLCVANIVTHIWELWGQPCSYCEPYFTMSFSTKNRLTFRFFYIWLALFPPMLTNIFCLLAQAQRANSLPSVDVSSHQKRTTRSRRYLYFRWFFIGSAKQIIRNGS